LPFICDYRILPAMSTLADRTIDALGGTTSVSRMTEAPVSTVHSWRKNGIPPSRLAHLKLAAQAAGYVMDWQTGALIRKVNVTAPRSRRAQVAA
jgi:hypothetical protein